MAEPTTGIYLNQTTPAAATGDQNIVFQTDGSTPQQSITAYPKRMVGDSGSGGKAGTVPPPAAGDTAAGKFLKADGSWAPAGTSPLTTKGDLYGHGTVDARVPVGTNGQALVADSTQTLGLRYADRVRQVQVTVIGSDLASAGLKAFGQVNFAGTIVGAAVVGDVSGSASAEVWKKSGTAPPTAPSVPSSGDKISGSTPLAISTAQTAAYDASALSGWSTLTVAKWDSIGFKLTGAATTVTNVRFVLYILETS
jgi:hypothetical protein